MFQRALMIAVAAAFPVVLAAQESPLEVIAHVLSLSEEQVQAVVQNLQARNEAIRPAAEELQRHQQALATLLQSENPDAATVGKLAIEMQRLQAQVQGVLEEANRALDQILNDEQRTRLEQLRGAAGACGVIPAFKAAGLL